MGLSDPYRKMSSRRSSSSRQLSSTKCSSSLSSPSRRYSSIGTSKAQRNSSTRNSQPGRVELHGDASYQAITNVVKLMQKSNLVGRIQKTIEYVNKIKEGMVPSDMTAIKSDCLKLASELQNNRCELDSVCQVSHIPEVQKFWNATVLHMRKLRSQLEEAHFTCSEMSKGASGRSTPSRKKSGKSISIKKDVVSIENDPYVRFISQVQSQFQSLIHEYNKIATSVEKIQQGHGKWNAESKENYTEALYQCMDDVKALISNLRMVNRGSCSEEVKNYTRKTISTLNRDLPFTHSKTNELIRFIRAAKLTPALLQSRTKSILSKRPSGFKSKSLKKVSFK